MKQRKSASRRARSERRGMGPRAAHAGPGLVCPLPVFWAPPLTYPTRVHFAPFPPSPTIAPSIRTSLASCRSANHRAGSSEPARRRRAHAQRRERVVLPIARPADHVVHAPISPSGIRLRRRDRNAEFRRRHHARATAPPITAPPASLSQLDDGERARSTASASSFKSHTTDLAVRAPVSPSGFRVRHRDRHAEFRWRHHARAAAPPITAPAPPSQLDDGEHAQRRERVVFPIARRRPRRACADLAVGNPHAPS